MIEADGDRHDGLVVVFARKVDVSLVDAAHVFTVDAPNPFARGEAPELGLRCRCPLDGRVEPVEGGQQSGGLVDQAR